MSSDKDKRSSKLFGTRISSIFNVQQGHNDKHVSDSSHGRSNLRGIPPKPLSHPPLDNKPTIPTRIPQQQPSAANIPPQSHVPPVPLKTVKSPPRRKPPPPLLDEFENTPDKSLDVDPSLVETYTGSANRHGEEVKDDLNNIIGSIEKEIDSMLINDEEVTRSHSHEYLHNNESGPSLYLTPDVNPLDLTTSNQSGESYYSDCSQSISESASASQIPSYLHNEAHDGTPTPTPTFAPNDTPNCNPNERGDIPYPTNTSLPLSPTSPTFKRNFEDQNLAMESGFKHGASNESHTSINSSLYLQSEVEPNLLDTLGSSHSIPSQRRKGYQTATSLSSIINSGSASRNTQNTPFIKSTNLQQSRNLVSTAPLEPIARDPPSIPKHPNGRPKTSHRRKSSSVSSIWSANSYRSVNMSKLKKSLDLKPGEGERSNYVLTIRRSAGTAYNESPPGKWKLPIGILPVDNRVGYTANGRYLRLAGGISQGRNKKTSGVELKHGHLQPRLLAAEVDDGDESPIGVQPLGRSGTELTISTTKSLPSGVKSSESSITAGSTRSGSLLRNSSFGKNANDDVQSINTGDSSATLPSSNKANSVSSSSSESINDFNIGIRGYYQHPGYLHNDDDESTEGDMMSSGEKHRVNDFNDYDARPRLVLANPDSSDDTD